MPGSNARRGNARNLPADGIILDSRIPWRPTQGDGAGTRSRNPSRAASSQARDVDTAQCAGLRRGGWDDVAMAVKAKPDGSGAEDFQREDYIGDCRSLSDIGAICRSGSGR